MKKYKTILADPPWPVEFIKLEMRPKQVEMPYPVMSIREISSLPIIKLADKECNLFMWTTHTFLPDSLEIIKQWGFKYHCLITWNKGNGRPHMGFKRNTEFILYAYRGKILVKQRGQYIKTYQEDIPDLFHEKLTVHSKKPRRFYLILEKHTPEPRIELFARNKRKGWDVWGNEVESDIKLDLAI